LTDAPFAFLPQWVMGFRSVAVALLDNNGNVVEANEGFLNFLRNSQASSAGVHFLDPPFFQLRDAPEGENGVVYSGLIILAAEQGFRRIFSGQVFRVNQMLFLAAEMDISAFEKLSTDVDRLENELDESRKQLARRNHALQKALEDLKELRGLDGLTGLPMRRQLDLRIDEEISRWERYRRPLALMVMDVDNFAEINNEYGRETADEMLKHVSTILQQTLRSADFAVRYGGQEFAVMLPETNEMGALIVAERLRMELESQIILPLVKPLTASFGVAMLMQGEDREELYARAERAVRHSKESGKNSVTMAGVISECDHIYQGMGRA
jgi:diguanylate cyclase (GGDEF)-like protein